MQKYEKPLSAAIALGGKRLKNVLLFFNTPKNMDIFFFIYSILYGLPLGVVQLPHGVDADGNRN